MSQKPGITSLETRSPGDRTGRICFIPFWTSGGLLPIFVIPCLVEASPWTLPSSSRDVLYVYVCMPIFPIYKDFILTNCFCHDPISNLESHSEVLGVRLWVRTYNFWGHNSTHNRWIRCWFCVAEILSMSDFSQVVCRFKIFKHLCFTLFCFFFLGAFTCLVFLTTANKCIIHVCEGCRDFIIQ